jgi:hypothetical protein
MCSYASIGKHNLKGVDDNYKEVGNDVHDNRDFVCHDVVHRPNKSYHPADAPDQDHAGYSQGHLLNVICDYCSLLLSFCNIYPIDCRHDCVEQGHKDV